jgi:hypothetical protein
VHGICLVAGSLRRNVNSGIPFLRLDFAMLF